jgi:hypothetical protein
MFADNTKVFRTIGDDEDLATLQCDISAASTRKLETITQPRQVCTDAPGNTTPDSRAPVPGINGPNQEIALRKRPRGIVQQHPVILIAYRRKGTES